MLCLVRHGLTVTIDHEGDVPVYVQLASILRARIESGDLPPRRAVPSKRMLMQEFGIAGGTVDKAIDILRGEAPYVVMADFHRKYIAGVEVPPYETILGYAGYKVESGSQKTPLIGIEEEETPEGIKIRRVNPNGPAAKAGLRAGDLLVNIDGLDLQIAVPLCLLSLVGPPFETALPATGQDVFDGLVVGAADGLSHRDLHRQMQMVFQDSYASLNPRLPVAMSIAFGPFVHGLAKSAALKRAMELLEAVGLEPMQFANRYPHELSGGQRQRINIARALALEPRIVILDEAVSALDKSVEAQVLNLLVDLKTRFDLTYVFISHDLNVVRFISDRVMVMYLGKLVEIGPVDLIYRDPQHPYTQALLSAMPSMDPRRRTLDAPLTGDPPNPISPPSGCRFRTRCPFAEGVCVSVPPALLALTNDASHAVACHIRVPGSGHSRAAAMVSA
jgi:peptide/nickel transport system ATP-binding protein